MSKGRTIKRNPIQLDASDYELNEQYFNFASFGGINSNKNFIGVNQYSFEDANNVYVDQDNQLHTRPVIKTINVFPYDIDIADIKKINNRIFYKTKNGNDYSWYYVINNTGYSVHTTEKSFITYIDNTYIIFNEDSIYGLRWNAEKNNFEAFSTRYVNSNGGYNRNDLVYIPVKEVVQSGSTVENEALNLLTTSYITRYLFEYGESIGSNNIELIGKELTVTIAGKTYTVTLQSGTPVVFAEPLAQINLDLAPAQIQSSSNGVILLTPSATGGVRNLYLSVDGQIFSIYQTPSEIGTSTCAIKLAKDGSEIIVANGNYSKVYDDPDNTSGKFKYITTIYYMYNPYESTNSGWNKIDVTLFEAYDNAATMLSQNVGPIYNVRFKGRNDDNGKAYISAYNGISSLLSQPYICGAETDEFVIVSRIALVGHHQSYTDNSYEPAWGDNATDANVSATLIIRVYVDNNGNLTSSVVFGDCQRTQSYAKSIYESDPFMYSRINGYLVPIEYVVTESYKIIVFQSSTQCTLPLVNGVNYSTYTYSSHDILYHVIDANDKMLHGFSVKFPNLTIANSVNAGSFEDVSYLYVIPCILNTMYKIKYSENYSPIITGTNRMPDLTNIDENALWLASYVSPTSLNYVNGQVIYQHIGGDYNSDTTVKNNILAKFIMTLQLGSWYDEDAYSNMINYGSATTYNDLHYSRMNYPITAAVTNDDIYSKNQVTLEKSVVSNYGSNYIIFNEGDILTEDYYYYKGIVYPLLKDDATDVLYPMYCTRETLDNSTNTYGKILYYNNTEQTVYTNKFTGYVEIDIVKEQDVNSQFNYIVPEFAEDFITTTIALDNLLYQSEKRTDDENNTPRLYFPVNTEVKFIDDITNLVVFSQTSLGVFLDSLVYEYQYNTDNNVYTLTPTKLQLGCKDGADILIGYDGSTIYMTQLKGMAGLTYEDFVQSTEQVYNYLTEAIMDMYDDFKGDGKIKLYQYKDWVFMYRQDNTILYLFDTRTSTWWKWTNPYPIQKMVYDGEHLLLLMQNQIVHYNFDTDNFSDFVGDNIEWFFRSQKLHFGAPNNYKHIRQLNVITTQSGHELRYKLKFINYRNLNNLAETDTVDFEIDQLTTLIKRVTFMKTNAFQFEISDDTTDDKPKYFETPDIAIKYRITERVR